jgi:hypothetical protein
MKNYKRPVFTTKHYETIVDLLSDIAVHSGFAETTVLEYFKDLFEEDNKKFKTKKFIDKYYKLKRDKTEEAFERAKEIYK